MSARDEAEKRLAGVGSGQAWHQVDAIRGVGWSLLALADAITSGVTALVESQQQSARTLGSLEEVAFGVGVDDDQAPLASGGPLLICPECRAGKHVNCTELVPDGDDLAQCACRTWGHQR